MGVSDPSGRDITKVVLLFPEVGRAFSSFPCHPIAKSEKRRQVRLNRIGVCKSDDLLPEYPFAVIGQRGRQAFNASELFRHLISRHSKRVANADFLGKLDGQVSLTAGPRQGQPATVRARVSPAIANSLASERPDLLDHAE